MSPARLPFRHSGAPRILPDLPKAVNRREFRLVTKPALGRARKAKPPAAAVC